MENISFSREKALPFSLEKLETIFNNLVQRDTYSNKILSEPLIEFYKREIWENWKWNNVKNSLIQDEDKNIQIIDEFEGEIKNLKGIIE